MRLLHTSTIKVFEFHGNEIPAEYAILSHTWGDAEVTIHRLKQCTTSELDRLEGYKKIKGCCALADREGYRYVWIDTCCIDKSSSEEVSEAINSMYRWYQDAAICYAYLSDVLISDEVSWSLKQEQELRESRWFTRGWTLQELLAPRNVVFLDKHWRRFGSKSSLRARISLITGIRQDHLFDIHSASVAQKMSWASRRETKRMEDIAYSLMGIFDVNMPLLYGEREKAFTRLQHEILKKSYDESIFAWMDDDLLKSGILAQSPKAFAQSGNIVQISDGHQLYVRRAPYQLTNMGLAFETFASEDSARRSISDLGFSFVPLNCMWQPQSGTASVPQLITLKLERWSRDFFIRYSPGQLIQSPWLINASRRVWVYIQPVLAVYRTRGQLDSFFIDAPLWLERGSFIPEFLSCHLGRFLWDGPDTANHFVLDRPQNLRPLMFVLGRPQDFAALLLKSYHGCQFMLGIILCATNGIPHLDLIVLSPAQSFKEEIKKYSQAHHPCDRGPTRICKTLQDSSSVSVALNGPREAAGKRQYYMEFSWCVDGRRI